MGGSGHRGGGGVEMEGEDTGVLNGYPFRGGQLLLGKKGTGQLQIKSVIEQ